MAHGKPGRRKATELGAERCAGTSAHGAKCGNPRLPDMGFCVHHLGTIDRAKAASTGERLLEMTTRALDALDEILLNGSPDAKVRAAKLILDRTQPATGSHAVYMHLLGGPVAGPVGALSASEKIRERMRMLAANRPPETITPATFFGDDDMIIDAEIIEDPTDSEQPPAA